MTDTGHFDLGVVGPRRAYGCAARRGYFPYSAGGPERVSVHSRPDEADDGIPVPDRLVVIEQGFGRFELELHQPLEAARLLLPQQRIAADESVRLVPLARETESGFQRRVLVGDVVAPMPVRLFDAQGIQRVVACVHEPVTPP